MTENIPTFTNHEEARGTPMRVMVPDGASALWDTLSRIGDRMADKTIAEEAQKQAKADFAAQGNKGFLPKKEGIGGMETTSSKAYNNAAEQAAGVDWMNNLDIRSRDIAEQYRYDPAGYRKEMDKFKGEFMRTVPLHLQDHFLAKFNDRDFHFGTQVQNNKKALDHDQAKAKTVTRLQTLQNDLYAMTEQLGAKAEESQLFIEKMTEYKALLENSTLPNELGAPLLSPMERMKHEEDTTQVVRKAELINAFRASTNKKGFIKAIETGGYDGLKLTPEVQKVAVGEMWTINNRLEQEHRQYMADLTDKVRDAEWRLWNGMKVNNLDNLRRKVGASGDSDLKGRLDGAAIAQTSMEAFGLKTIPQMAQELDAERARINSVGTTDKPDAMLYQKKLSLYHGALQSISAGDAIGYAAERGVVTNEAALAPLNLDDDNSIAMRKDAVRAASQLIGQPVPMLRPSEIKTLQRRWDGMGVDEKVKILDRLNSLGVAKEEHRSTLEAISGESPSLGLFANLLANPQHRSTAIKGLEGLDYAKNNPDAVDKDHVAKREIANALSPYLPLGPDGRPIDQSGKTSQQLTEWAFGLYAVKTKEGGDFSIGSGKAETLAKKAVAEMFGYNSYSDLPTIHGNRVVPFERGMPHSKVTQVWASITDDDLRAMNGGALPTDNAGTKRHELTAEHIRKNGTPVYDGRAGKYRIQYQDPSGNWFFLTGKDGRAFVWDYSSFSAEYKARAK